MCDVKCVGDYPRHNSIKMRYIILYGLVLVCALVVFDVQADRKWKSDFDVEKRLNTQRRNDLFSRKNIDSKKEENKTGVKYGNQPKRFIGRIEHGKVMVLRKKPVGSEEDHKQSVCRKLKGNAVDCSSKTGIENDSSSNEDTKPVKKIKYSIKFKHEKQKKMEFSPDNSILRLHKNDRKYGKFDDDDDSSEEDDNPIKKPFHFMDDDDD